MKLNRRERLGVLLALAYIACCACTSSSRSALKVDTAATLDESATARQTVTETVRTGPETITTTVYEFAPAEQGKPRRAVKRTVTVDQRGPIIAKTTERATETAQEHATATSATAATSDHQSAPKGLFGSLLGLWPLLLLGALALAGWIGWRVLRSRLP